ANTQNAIELSLGWRLKRKASAKRSQPFAETAPEATMPETTTVLDPLEKEESIEESIEARPQEVAIQQLSPLEDTTNISPSKEGIITPEERETLETKIAF